MLPFASIQTVSIGIQDKNRVGFDFPKWDARTSKSHANTAEFFQSEYTRKPVKVLSVLLLE